MDPELEEIFRLCTTELTKVGGDARMCVALLQRNISGQASLSIADRQQLAASLGRELPEPAEGHMSVLIVNEHGEGVLLEAPYQR